MLEAVYGWIQNISVYLIVTAAVMHAVPGKDYGKYIRFFSGLVLILLVFTPLLKVMGMGDTFHTLYKGKEYEMNRREIEMAEEIYENFDLSGLLGIDPFPGESSADESADAEGDTSDNGRGVSDGNKHSSEGNGTTGNDIEETASSRQGESRGRIKVEEIKIGE